MNYYLLLETGYDDTELHVISEELFTKLLPYDGKFIGVDDDDMEDVDELVRLLEQVSKQPVSNGTYHRLEPGKLLRTGYGCFAHPRIDV